MKQKQPVKPNDNNNPWTRLDAESLLSFHLPRQAIINEIFRRRQSVN